MAVTKKWDGIGAANGPMTISSAGSGDNAFSVVSAGLTVSNGTIVVPSTTNTAVTYVRWNDLGLSAWSTRCYIQFDGNTTGIAHIIYAWGTTNARIWSVTLNTSRQIELRNVAGSSVGIGPAITLGVKYRFEIRGQAGTDSVTFKVFNASETEIYAVTSAIGTTLGLLHLQYGRQQSSIQFGPASYSNLQVNNTNATIGAYVPPPVAAPWVVLNGNGTTTALTLNGVWSGSAITPLDVGQVTPIGPIGETRDVFKHPWATSSWHNTAIGSGAIYEAAGTGTTGFLQTYNTFTPGIGIGINQARWSVRIFQAKSTDPTVNLVYYKEYIGNTNPAPVTYQIKCPRSAVASGGTDRHVMVVQPDGFTGWEIYKFIWHDSTQTQIDSTYVNVNDIRKHGLKVGSRGSGISLLSGLMRYQELIDLNIPHTLAMSVPDDMLTTAAVPWPARLYDNQTDRQWGNLPNAVQYGHQFAIHSSVDLTNLGLTPMGLAIGRALQDYGVFPLVQADHITLIAEPVPSLTYTNQTEVTMSGLSAAADDWKTKLFPLLRRITNNNPGAINSDRVPLDSSGIAGGGTRRRPAPLFLPGESA